MTQKTSLIVRLREMPPSQILGKLKKKAYAVFAPSINLRRFAYALEAFTLKRHNGSIIERPEFGPSNLGVKLRRQALGGPFEPLDVALVNHAVVQLSGPQRSILEIGSGTGLYASLMADAHPDCKIVASEFEDATRDWAIRNRSRSNITYCRSRMDQFTVDFFAQVVALEVVEHIHDYAGFLKELSRVAPRAIVSTPNKLRSASDSIANPPEFEQHVREWSTEAFYWVLRCFWDEVELYTVPRIHAQMKEFASHALYRPTVAPTGLHGREHAMIAICTKPRR